jgi:carbonic anhydrase
MNWLKEICEANHRFKEQIDIDVLPTERQPCPYAIVTCMDPRVNLESVGIRPFTPNGESSSQIRVIRTIGGMHENRSLAVGIHLAGFKEIAVLMHTDCGCSLAYHKVDKIIENMEANLGPKKLKDIKNTIGEPFRENLLEWLHAFQNPREAVKKEVADIKDSPFVPDTLNIHGLVYDLSSGGIEVVVNGYER